MQEEFADGFRLVVLEVAVAVLVDVRVIEQDFAFFDTREGIRDLAFACAKGFDFRAFKDDAGLENFGDMIIAPGFGIGEDVWQNRASWLALRGRPLVPLALLRGCLDDFDLFGHVPADFAFDDLFKGDIRHAQVRVIDQRTAQGAGAGRELAYAPGDEIDQHVRVADLR